MVSHDDLAPTVLKIAGEKFPATMTDGSLLSLLRTVEEKGRERVFFARERHANVRRGDFGFPVRAIRTREFQYVRNLRPDLSPTGDPKKWVAVGGFGDVDEGSSKLQIIARRDQDLQRYFRLGYEKHPGVELDDLIQDPSQLEALGRSRRRSRRSSTPN